MEEERKGIVGGKGEGGDDKGRVFVKQKFKGIKITRRG